MVEHEALKKLKHKDERALEWFIDRYAAYVNTIIYNIIGRSMSSADIEEVSSDVFFTLWVNAKRISPGKVKAYLGGVARNKAKEYTRKIGTGVSLEDDVILISEENLEQVFIYHILLIEMINPNYITHLDNVVRIHHCLVRVSLKDL